MATQRGRGWPVAWLALLLGIAVGCAGPRQDSQPVPKVAPEGNGRAAAEEAEYRLAPGDVLAIKFYYDSNLNDRVTIRPDGKISLQLLDDITAAGLTSGQLDGLLTQRYSRFFKKPELTVTVEKFSRQRVYVGGEVKAPQVLELVDGMTVAQAIFQAGGALETANLSSILVLRDSGEDSRLRVLKLNVAKDLQGGGSQSLDEIRLQPCDVIYVPKTFIARADLFVSQYINQIIPRSVNFFFSYDLNPEVKVESDIKNRTQVTPR